MNNFWGYQPNPIRGAQQWYYHNNHKDWMPEPLSNIGYPHSAHLVEDHNAPLVEDHSSNLVEDHKDCPLSGQTVAQTRRQHV